MRKKILDHFKLNLFMYIILGIVVSFLSALNIYFLQNLLDSVAQKMNYFWISGYTGTLLLLPVLSYFSEYPFSKLRYGIFYYLKKEALRKMSTIDYLGYLESSSGAMLQKIEAGANAGRDMYVHFYCRLLREIIPEAIFNVSFIALINMKIIPFILIGYIFIFVLTKILLTFLYSIKESTLMDEENLSVILVRGITELLTFRINRRYKKELETYSEISKQTANKLTKMTMVHEAFFALFFFLVSLLKVVLVILFFQKSLSVTIGGFIALLNYIDKIYTPIAILNVLFVQYRLDKVTYERLEQIFKIQDDKKLISSHTPIENIESILVDNISFSIGNKEIINRVSFELEKGKTYALLGKSGAGKSTLLKIIMGLLNVDKGKVYFNKQDIDGIDIDSLYSRIFYISQDAPIFEGSLRENIVFEKEVMDIQIEEALKKCQLEDFYRKLPYKLHTRIGERGTTLSGGERQRIAFARLFFADVDVIILDEATSALDNQTEKKLQEETSFLFQDKIVILVTHKKRDLYQVDETISL